MPLSLSSSNTSYTGLVPGWLLSFSAEQNGQPSGDAQEFGTDDYEGDISASLQSGLQGGSYSFTITWLTDDTYRLIKPMKIVRLFLYFRDNLSSPLGYLENLVGLPGGSAPSSSALKDNLVADLRVTSVTRAIGERGYTTTIKARERIYDLLTTTSLSASKTPAPMGQMIDFIMHNAQTPLVAGTHYTYYPPPAPEPNSGKITAGTSRSQLVTQLANALERASKAYGRGMLLVRDGMLHIGKRPIPFATATDGRLTLDAPSGLVQSERLDAATTDPGPSGSADAARTRWRLTLSGRPDLKPGDFVTFPTPDGDERRRAVASPRSA